MMSGAWRFVIRARRESRSRRIASDGAISARAADCIRSSACRNGRIGSVDRTGSALMAWFPEDSVGRSRRRGRPAARRRSRVRGTALPVPVTGSTHGRRSRNDNTLANSANLPLNQRVAAARAMSRPGSRRHGHETQAVETRLRAIRQAAPRTRPHRCPARTSLVDIAQQLRSWTDSVLGVAGAAADVTLGAAKMMLPKPGQRAALERTGAVLRRLRETAGLSVDEVGNAIDLKDPALLELVENGKVALPFEIILRLASVLGRNDPISFVMRFTRSYNPDVWKTLEVARHRPVGGAGRARARVREPLSRERRGAPPLRRGIRRSAEVHAGRIFDGARVARRHRQARALTLGDRTRKTGEWDYRAEERSRRAKAASLPSAANRRRFGMTGPYRR